MATAMAVPITEIWIVSSAGRSMSPRKPPQPPDEIVPSSPTSSVNDAD
jgi:hypothetical protein